MRLESNFIHLPLLLSGPLHILGQQYHRNEYSYHKALKQAKFFICVIFCPQGRRQKRLPNNSTKSSEEQTKDSVRESAARYLISLCLIFELVGIKVKFQAS